MKTAAKKFKINQYQTTAYHPQSNGSIKRSHHVLAEFLKYFIKNNEEWDDWVVIMAMLSYNTSIHEGTRFTPHELVYGQIAEHRTMLHTNEQLQRSQEAAKENLDAAKAKYLKYIMTENEEQ